MKNQKTKYRTKKDMNSFKERVSMKEDTTTPKKLLSPKGAIVFPSIKEKPNTRQPTN
jgi:hypothetical protein